MLLKVQVYLDNMKDQPSWSISSIVKKVGFCVCVQERERERSQTEEEQQKTKGPQ